MFAKKCLHEDTNRICIVVLTQILDARQLKDFFFCEIVLFECGLLYDLHKDLERLIDFAAQTVEHVSKEIWLVHDLYARAGVLQPPGDIFGIESPRASKRGAQHEFSNSR